MENLNLKEREELLCRFREAAEQGTLSDELIWETLSVFAGKVFYTYKGMEFVYSIRGHEMFVDRKEKSITRSTVLLYVRKALELQAAGEMITRPKQVGVFGASYLFPVFKELGLII